MGGVDRFEHPDGATPLDPDEADGLIPQHITTQGQLNEWEQVNILEAEKWVARQNFTLAQIASVEFLKDVHQRMFGKTWRWARQFRQTNKNIGVDWLSIFVDLKLLMDDTYFQIENNSYAVNECAVRFHHRLVAIHPFPNGNGRHARLLADILLLSQGMERFSWGKTADLLQSSSMRSDYITALRKADKMDYSALIEFVQPTVTSDSESA